MTTTETTETQSTNIPAMAPAATPAPAALPDHVRAACDIAAGRVAADPAAGTVTVRAALNDWGKDHWYRMVWSAADDAWRYFAERRLEEGYRYSSVDGRVAIGDLVARHDRGCPIDAIWVVADRTAKPLRACKFAARGDGRLSITLPDGTVIDRPNPRR
jgi:hypothetical protein